MITDSRLPANTYLDVPMPDREPETFFDDADRPPGLLRLVASSLQDVAVTLAVLVVTAVLAPTAGDALFHAAVKDGELEQPVRAAFEVLGQLSGLGHYGAAALVLFAGGRAVTVHRQIRREASDR